MSQIGMPNRFRRPEDSGARNRSERICLIVNPSAGAGRARKSLDELKRATDRAFEQWEVRTTEGPGHATALAAEAVDQGFALVAAVGGDGTAHEVARGMVDEARPRSRPPSGGAGGGDRRRRAALCLVPFGTGGDLRKTLEIPRSLSGALWVAATGISLPTDVGLVTLQGPDGPREDTFINVAGFGAQGEVVARANRMDKRMGGRLVFLVATVKTSLTYRPRPIRIHWEGPEGAGSWDQETLSCFVANGRYCGGGMWVAPEGTMHDGLFDVTLMRPLSIPQQLLNVQRLYNGGIARFPGARHLQVSELRAEPTTDEPVEIDLDGETPGRLPATFRVAPRALHVRGGWVNSPLTPQPVLA